MQLSLTVCLWLHIASGDNELFAKILTITYHSALGSLIL